MSQQKIDRNISAAQKKLDSNLDSSTITISFVILKQITDAPCYVRSLKCWHHTTDISGSTHCR